jgi:flagellar basal-body rod protein FlgC
MTDLTNAMAISSYGMRAQGARIKVISENVANAGVAAATPNENPYVKQSIIFKNELDRNLGLDLVKVQDVRQDSNVEFPQKYMPDHPGANASGFVKMPNVEPLIELADMREAQRSYEANLGMVENSRRMIMQTIDILRS